MISRLLTLAKLESGTEDFDWQKIDLAELVKDIAADADFEAQAKDRFVEVSAADQCVGDGQREPVAERHRERPAKCSTLYIGAQCCRCLTGGK
jgi:signal transduction histidine kinase